MNVLFLVDKTQDESLNEIAMTMAREEANELAKWNAKYRICIPEKRVEVMSCISWSIEQNVGSLMSGARKFKNRNFPNVEILEATRFQKNTEPIASSSTAATQGGRESLPTVRVTFAGLILPEYLVTADRLLVPVREFKRRQMFCTTCLSYRHTASHCNNKAQISPLGFSCIHCKNNDHNSGDKSCPKRKNLEKRDQTRTKIIRKKTYAEMLQELDPNAVMPDESTNAHFPVLTGTKRQRMEMRTQSTSNHESPTRKRPRNESQTDRIPPGFRNTADATVNGNENGFSLGKFLIPIINDLVLPSWLKQIVFKFVIPFVDNLFNQLTNSCADQFLNNIST